MIDSDKRYVKYCQWWLTDCKEYDSIQRYLISVNCTTRGCTGFDGLTEDGEAVRGRAPR